MHKVMREFKQGKLHSGSKHGPEVHSRKQAIAIGMSEARGKALKHRIIHSVKNLESARKHKTHTIMARVDAGGNKDVKR